MADSFLTTQISDTKTMIANITAAINALLTGDHSSYELDTGQTRQRVTRLDLENLRKMRKDLFSELAELEAAAGVGSNTITGLPGF